MLYILTALKSEAKPIIQAFDLKSAGESNGVLFYAGESVCLAISGVGKTQMLSAVSELEAKYQGLRESHLINIGICGASREEFTKGKLFRINRIVDKSSGDEYILKADEASGIAQVGLHTFDTEVTKSILNDDLVELVDMEASAFYQSAIEFVSSDRLHVLKVVSDHLEERPAISAKIVNALIAGNIDAIKSFCVSLSGE